MVMVMVITLALLVRLLEARARLLELIPNTTAVTMEVRKLRSMRVCRALL